MRHWKPWRRILYLPRILRFRPGTITSAPIPIGQILPKLREQLGLTEEQFFALGRVDGGQEFNMTALAIRGSRFQNGVSRIHGGVSSHICAPLWPEIDPRENPLSYVTNGVHLPTFLAPEWADQFDKFLGFDWSHHAGSHGFQERLETMPDHLFWSVRQSLKAQMLHLVRHRVARQHARNHGSEAHLDRLLRYADPINPNVLTVGFARRFANLQARDAVVPGPRLASHDFRKRRQTYPVPVRGQSSSRDIPWPGRHP
jgi:alpha-glucan phosphorylase-like protein